MTTIRPKAPMELRGSHPGISVIDPASVLSRLWYFDGKFLRAEGFRLDQQYVRSLVALSNQAVGHGVVHGFDVVRRSGSTLRVEGGLALAPSGRVVFLPSEVDLSVAELVARSSGELGPGRPSAASPADFAPCPPQVPGDAVTATPPRTIYVLTAAATEALCGEEERFDKLCSDACGTDTDRSVAVEGVRFRVRQLTLPLPVSARVPFDARHLRSRVATAYFAQERRAVPAMISGAGLSSVVWCAGADGIGGEEVPLAVFEHSGSVATWLDMWTARRELVETTPQRYWAWRLAMRPLDVALAQLLQFQCQVLDEGAGGGGGDAPCADERGVLAEADDVLAGVIARDPDGGLVSILDELRTRLSGALTGRTAARSGSILLDRGLVSLPPAGYLVVDPSRSVERQVHALMGPGVDLRFCAVRPDFIPEALQEAQHMERISLTQGIDDPAALEEVDVLVPGGVVAQTATGITAFEGRLRLLPSERSTTRRSTTGSVLSLAAVARDQVQDGWSWTLAAYGEASQRLTPGDLPRIFDAVVTRPEPDSDRRPEPRLDLYVETDDVNARTMTEASFLQRAKRESRYASAREERMLSGIAGEVREPAADRALAGREHRPFSAWFDVETDRDLREVAIGGRASLRLRATSYSRDSTEPFFADAQLTGGLVVRSKVERTSLSGGAVVDIVTDVVGGAEGILVAGGQERGPVPIALSGTSLRWRVGLSKAGVRILSVSPEDRRAGLVARFEDRGRPRRTHGVLTRPQGVQVDDGGLLAAPWAPSAADDGGLILADLDLHEAPGALDAGSRGRDLGEVVIGVISAELAVRGRDSSFGVAARRRLFGAERAGGASLTATADWVMFHRRRTKTCAGAVDRPSAVRRLQWFHALVDDPKELRRLSVLAERGELSQGVDQLGFAPVTVLEFAEGGTELTSSRVAARAAWAAAPRGTRLLAGVAASPPTSDGTHIDLARLMAAISTVADVIDTSETRTTVVSQIPAQLQTAGIDAVLLTVGHEEPAVDEYTATVVWRTINAMEKLRARLGQVDRVTPEVLEELLGRSERFVVRFHGSELVNLDELHEWWGDNRVADRGMYGISTALAGVDAADALTAAWVDQIRAALGGGPGLDHLDQVAWELPDTHMIVLVTDLRG